MTGDPGSTSPSALRAIAHSLLAMAEELDRSDPKHHLGISDAEMVPAALAVELAARWHADRERRAIYFDRNLIGEPAWDMLLYLFAREAEGQGARVSQAVSASGAPATTGLRYVKVLVDAGMVAQSACESDGRVTLLSLTAEGRTRMSAYLARTIRARRGAMERSGAARISFLDTRRGRNATAG